MHQLRHLILFLLISLAGCHSKPDAPQAPLTDHSHMIDTSAVANEEADTSGLYSIQDTTAVAEFVVDTTNLTPEPNNPIKILLEGLYHKEEVWKGAEDKQWFGLFDKNGSYELRPTSLKVEPAFDPAVDATRVTEEGSKLISGRQVVGADTSTMVFITGLTNIEPGTVDTAAFDKNVIPINKEAVLSFKGKEYRIEAFGDSTLLETGDYSYKNYGWRISGPKKGRLLKQVLSKDEEFQQSTYILYWAGDIDRDGIPDLIAELSNHYNTTRTALFLSSKAEKGKLYKKVAVFDTKSK
ncbi:hypothetical protein ACFSKU_16095 [Pontibacter silvestris]|uniref:Lipoprotein n=1 Tax=Pontibacter silvestris TaxID=2305183 RepID=A0ABW4X2N5_9BACT|nr:hypothetical protein [Pontibacter silvestris]MCC9135992.1 hypothetical protein [Pontibacter silvestris]